jgi:PAS domain S-box-containing protein
MAPAAGASVELDATAAFELFDLMTASVAVYDRAGRVLYVNQATATLFGRARADLVGGNLWTLFPEAIGDHFHQVFQRVAAGGEAESFDHHYAPWDRWFWSLVSPCAAGILVYAHETTAEHRSRERMHMLAQAAREIAGSVLEPATAYARIARTLAEALRDACAIRVLGDDGLAETVAYHHVDPGADRAIDAQATERLTAPVFATAQPLILDETWLRPTDPERFPLLSAMALPMLAAGRLFGVIALLRTHTPRAYDADELALARELTDRAAAALVNARLYAAQEQARRSAERLLRFTEALAGCVSAPEVAAATVSAARVLLEASASTAWIGGAVAAHAGEPRPVAPPPEAVEALGRRAPLVREGLAVLPLVAAGHAVGVVTMGFPAARRLGADERDLLAAMTAQATLALERCQLFSAEREARAAALRSARRSSRLQEATLALTGASGSHAVAHELLRVAAEALDARAGAVLVPAPGGAEVELLSALGFPRERVLEWRRAPIAGSLAGQVIATGRPLWLEDLGAVAAMSPAAGARAERLAADIGARPGALAVVPLRVGAAVTGALALTFDGPRAFGDDDRELLLALTALASQALDRARLFDADAASRRAVEAANAKLEAIIVATPAPVLMVDAQQRVELWNPAAERTFGWSAAEVLGRELPIVPDDRREEFRALLERVVGGGGVAGFETVRRRRDRTLIAASVWAAPVYLPDGTVHYLAVVLDMTERRQAEEALREAGRRKDEFLALLGHELRNPLAPILTAVELLKLRDGGAASREVATIERQARHLVALVDDLLDVARITRGKVSLRRERLELGAVVAQALESVSSLIEQRRHAVEVDVPREGLRVHGDTRRLVQIVSNLLTNAATYTPPGGRIVVRARRDGEAVELAVRDSGVGFTAEIAARMFEPFVQGHRVRERLEGGLGLGLALVRGLVELHGGQVRASSDGPGQGSTFTVTLPLAAAAPAPAPPAAGPATASPRPAARILVVDDNRDAAELLAEALNAAGHEAVAAFGPTEALRCVESFTPDVAVLDVAMPVMDGYELGARLRARFGAALRLVAVTGYGQDRDHERSREAGFHAHLVKPVELSALLAAADGK